MRWEFGPYVLDMDNACLWREETRLAVRPKTFDLLAHLVEHADELVTKENLLEAIWPDTAIAEGALTTSISELRKVLGETARHPTFIATVPRRGYRFIAPVTQQGSPQTRSAARPTNLIAPNLVGREAELGQLHQSYQQALSGNRQVVFMTGEAGIGKTTLLDAFIAQLPQTNEVWISRGQCIHHYGEGEPYLPLLEALGHLTKGDGGSQVIDVLYRHGPSWLLQLPALFPQEEAGLSRRQYETTTRERMLRELAESVETLTASRPLIVVLEDLHWSDNSTLDWLDYIARRGSPAQLLILGTYRPIDAMIHDHPVRAVTQELRVHKLCEELVLDYLSEAGVAAYLTHHYGSNSFSPTFCQRLHQRTNGNPLFLVNVMQAIRQRQGPRSGDPIHPLFHERDVLTIEIPDTLKQFIEQQIRALAPEDQAVLEAASVSGVEFATTAVAAALNISPETVEARCDDLVRNQHFIRSCGLTTWPDSTITATLEFQHALYTEVFYDRAPLNRRVRWHHRMGLCLEAAYGKRARDIAATLGEHFRRGQDAERAVQYLQYAGETSVQRHANQEAILHLTQALELLPTLPETLTRDQQELALRTTLGVPLVAIQGYATPEVEQTYTRAYTLCQQLRDSQHLNSILFGLWRIYSMRGRLNAAREITEQLLDLAQYGSDPFQLVEAHRAMGVVRSWLGDLTEACDHLEQGFALYNRRDHAHYAYQSGLDVGVSCLSMAAVPLWMLGYPDRAATQSEQAITLAQELNHPFSLSFALINAARLYHFRREWSLVLARAEAVETLATEHNFALWQAVARRWRGVALAAQGSIHDGIDLIHQGQDAYQATGTATGESYYRLLLAEAYFEAGQVERGLAIMGEALNAFEQAEDRLYEAEVYRLKGKLLLASRTASPPEVESCFRQALSAARRQKAKSLELRAFMSLAQLEPQNEARAGLAEVYAGFVEGFDTLDLQEANALLTQ